MNEDTQMVDDKNAAEPTTGELDEFILGENLADDRLGGADTGTSSDHPRDAELAPGSSALPKNEDHSSPAK